MKQTYPTCLRLSTPDLHIYFSNQAFLTPPNPRPNTLFPRPSVEDLMDEFGLWHLSRSASTSSVLPAASERRSSRPRSAAPAEAWRSSENAPSQGCPRRGPS